MPERNPLVYASMSFEVHSVWDPMGERDTPSEWETPIEIVGEATDHSHDDGPAARIHALLFTDWQGGLDPEAGSGSYLPSWVESLLDPNVGGLARDVPPPLNQDRDALEAGDLLTIQRMEVLPAYRGEGLGRVLMEELIFTFGRGASLIALKAHPLQYETVAGHVMWSPWGPDWYEKMALTPGNTADFVAERKQLMGYYGRTGFTALDRNDGLMVMPGRTSTMRPRKTR